VQWTDPPSKESYQNVYTDAQFQKLIMDRKRSEGLNRETNNNHKFMVVFNETG
jgi:hypothetical protein